MLFLLDIRDMILIGKSCKLYRCGLVFCFVQEEALKGEQILKKKIFYDLQY